MRELMRYMHLNPVRAGIVTELSRLIKYPYRDHSSIMRKEDPPWQDAKYGLGCFGQLGSACLIVVILYRGGK